MYGLATAYSASHVVMATAVTVVIGLLLGEGVAGGLVLQWATMLGLMELHAIYRQSSGQQGGN